MSDPHPMHQPLNVDALRRAEFPSLHERAYLNAAAVTPLPERARAAVEAFQRKRSRIHELQDPDFPAVLGRCREAAARLIGAGADEIALGGNTSFGINLAAQGLPMAAGSVILASEGEFPTNVYPWMAQAARGVRLEVVPADSRGRPDEERMLERLGRGDVAVLALSAVQFGSGFRADLARFGAACREHGVFFVVDAIQALGCVPIDVGAAHVDVLACGGHKWLCGPFGSGFVYVRRGLHEVLEPRVIGWTAMEACRDFASLTSYRWEWVNDARRYEVGTLPFQELAGLAAAAELLLDVGVERIERHVAGLLDRLVEGVGHAPGVEILTDLTPGRRSGILAFRLPAAEAAYAALQRGGVVCALRESAIRIAPHLYSTEADVERVIEIISAREWE